MPGHRGYGMDHDHYAWSPITARPVLRWPGGARVAFAVLVSLAHTEWRPPEGSVQASGSPFPSVTNFSQREYGHRVGIYRLLRLLDRLGIPASVAIDRTTANHMPALVRYVADSGAEVLGHGTASTQMLSERMDPREEASHIVSTLDSLERAGGVRPTGWLGPDFGESTRTPGLLAEAGVGYVCDWGNDDQPYEMTTAVGALTSLPATIELDDFTAMSGRHLPADTYYRMVLDAFEQLHADGAETGRLLVLPLRAWLSGQPFRTSFLAETLGEVTARQGVWAAHTGSIVQAYREAHEGSKAQ